MKHPKLIIFNFAIAMTIFGTTGIVAQATGINAITRIYSLCFGFRFYRCFLDFIGTIQTGKLDKNRDEILKWL
ncbi:hypothetical protein [Polycladospora coralii]|uniref:hypothetical protein n=1 Tax=Polycladospora coralii TaxID=2771432 RepID=UPI0020BF5D67|nr:hypothetical protein [Polycladospora coralii]